MLKKILYFTAILIGSSSAFSQVQTVIPLKIIHGDAMSSSNGKTLFKLQEILEAKYPAKFKISIINNSKISNTGGDIDAVNLGSVDMALINSDTLSNYYKKSELDYLNIPYVTSTTKQYKQLLNNGIIDAISKSVQSENNVEIAAFWPTENKYIMSTEKFDELKFVEQKKWITRNKEINSRFVKTMNAEPVLLDVGDSESKYAYAYGISKVVDQTPEAAIKNYEKFKIKTVINFPISRENYVIIISKSWLRKLNNELRSDIVETIREIGLRNVDIMESNEKKDLETLRTQYDVSIITPNKWEQLDLQQAGKMVNNYFLLNTSEQFATKIKSTNNK